MKKGLFIMLEGTDGSGKTTQTEFLVARLKQESREVESISFPQYGKPSAAMVEAYLHGEFGTAEDVGPYCASILYAVDRYAAKKTIKQWLNDGKIVIANRYVGSNMGHQGGKIKNHVERRRYFAWNYELEYTIFQIPKPDINLILHMPADMAQSLVDQKGEREYLKGKRRDIHEDDLKHLQDAEQAYLDLARQFPEFKIVECVENGELLSKEDVHKKIWQFIYPIIINP